MDGRGGASELKSTNRALARYPSILRRRTALRLWCGVSFFALAFSACRGSEEAATDPPTVLTLGLPEEVQGAELGLGQLITAFTLEGLTQVSVDGRALPRLAETWNWENEGRTLRVTLRAGVRFHDGTPLTAALAAQVLTDAIERPGNRALYPLLNDVTAVLPQGDLQLVLELSQPSAFLPEELELPLGIGAQNVGTGAFRLVTRDTDGVVLDRFDDYYLGAPRIERIVIRPFDTLRTAWTSLLRGEVDMVTDVPADAVQFIQTNDIQVVSFARRYQFVVAFNSQRPPFTSATVRRALNTAIDRNRLIETVLHDRGEAATGPLWPGHWAYDASVQAFGFDPRGAVSLLEGAGFSIPDVATTSALPPARLRFTCLVPENFTLLERIGLEVQKQLYDVGVDVQFEVVPAAEFNRRIGEGRFQAVLLDLISGPTLARPYVFWGSAKARQGLNTFGYENAETERLFRLLHTSTNEAVIRSATSRLQRALLEDPPALFLAWNERARAIRQSFRIVQEPSRDPLHTIWQWTENPDSEAVSTR